MHILKLPLYTIKFKKQSNHIKSTHVTLIIQRLKKKKKPFAHLYLIIYINLLPYVKPDKRSDHIESIVHMQHS